ncbi:hypothetical protein N9R27_01260 [Flavobacteriaceae bacterium]|nr:hypothetical protein [Flavobacteriaceae bacterium]|tara:strand:- start:215 stop:361 length:147 start_codon:yes stop_codon:yes gene_type:complete
MKGLATTAPLSGTFEALSPLIAQHQIQAEKDVGLNNRFAGLNTDIRYQ